MKRYLLSWSVPVAVLCALAGAVLGLGSYTFWYAEGGSYFSNDPRACVNCHVMREQFDGWIVSSHRAVAVCNDCHAPHDPVGKYATKAVNGFWHSVAFTTGRYPDPLRIKAHNRVIAEEACRKCHRAIVDAIDPSHRPGAGAACLACHHAVGHL